MRRNAFTLKVYQCRMLHKIDSLLCSLADHFWVEQAFWGKYFVFPKLPILCPCCVSVGCCPGSCWWLAREWALWEVLVNSVEGTKLGFIELRGQIESEMALGWLRDTYQKNREGPRSFLFPSFF